MNVEITKEQLALSKEARYRELLKMAEGIIFGEDDPTANLANITAVIKELFDFLWVGFYLVKGNELVLGPFQGPPACTRIRYGKGVCGTAWKEQKTIIVDDVEQFPGHIACSSRSRSEMVIPVYARGEVCMVLDIDSETVKAFDEIDRHYLEEMLLLLKC
ncbi:MAG: GAF domain-containing protein [Bacteroidales bacterium]|jgi:GAF domain-containing protein|nr:GAF domain-containing protein [Bacteroidales bacterium]